MIAKEWNQARLLETSGQYWKGSTLHAGVKLDVFTTLGDEMLTGRQVARSLGCDQRAMTMLLDALTSMGLLEKSAETFRNTPASRSLLSKNSPDYMGYIIIHHQHLVESWSKLDQAVRTGEPVRGTASYSDEQWRENFLMGMFNIAMNTAPLVAKAIDLSNRRHLLDLGGGPGTYAIHFCLANPMLKATVYDLPTTRPFAEKTIKRFALTDRIDFVAGDYLEEGVAGQYDAAWLSHVLHAESPDGCRRMIQKAVDTLEPGGLIIVHDFILDNTMDRPVFAALFSLNMLLGTSGGQSYSEEQFMEMLTEAGARHVERIPFKGPNDSGILAGVVK